MYVNRLIKNFLFSTILVGSFVIHHAPTANTQKGNDRPKVKTYRSSVTLKNNEKDLGKYKVAPGVSIVYQSPLLGLSEDECMEDKITTTNPLWAFSSPYKYRLWFEYYFNLEYSPLKNNTIIRFKVQRDRLGFRWSRESEGFSLNGYPLLSSPHLIQRGQNNSYIPTQKSYTTKDTIDNHQKLHTSSHYPMNIQNLRIPWYNRGPTNRHTSRAPSPSSPQASKIHYI